MRAVAYCNDDPLVAIRRPDADAIAGRDAEREQAARDRGRRVPQLAIGRAVALRAHDERLAIAEPIDGAAQVLADRLAEQRGRAGAVRVREHARSVNDGVGDYGADRRAIRFLISGTSFAFGTALTYCAARRALSACRLAARTRGRGRDSPRRSRDTRRAPGDTRGSRCRCRRRTGAGCRWRRRCARSRARRRRSASAASSARRRRGRSRGRASFAGFAGR